MTKEELKKYEALDYARLEEPERETHIWIDSKRTQAIIETTDRYMMMKLDKLCNKAPDKWELEEIQTLTDFKEDGSTELKIAGKVYKCLIECVYLRAGKKKISEENKKAFVENMAKARTSS